MPGRCCKVSCALTLASCPFTAAASVDDAVDKAAYSTIRALTDAATNLNGCTLPVRPASCHSCSLRSCAQACWRHDICLQ